ncbi:MAG: amidophosphoribosyltransferase [Deltaproteobacteria bacterium]|nr:amidophosphoribosyltransferase [Deltaproteobacteria bacterium]
MKEFCGLFGISGHEKAAWLTYLGLYSLQHRGQESAGIAVARDGSIVLKKDMGLVSDVFNPDNLEELGGGMSVGHVRYSTTGSSQLVNAQPFMVRYARGTVAIAHNGNLVNARELRSRLEGFGAIFQTTMDSEVIVHLLAKPTYPDLEHSLIRSLEQVKGAYSLVLLTPDTLVGARDPKGFRPLSLGIYDGAYVLASETCALDLIGADYVRDIEPGEIVFLNGNNMRSVKPFPPARTAYCIFEHIYFARPDSRIFGHNVHQVRKELGRQLAREQPVDAADIVISVPDSGNSAAMGYSEESGILYEMGLVRNHYIGRTFIDPYPEHRDLMVRIKINPIRDVLQGKRVVVVDDSIVRATTSRRRVDTLRAAGVREIHMRISSPPITHSCYYGIDTPTREELIASSKSTGEIARIIGVDSLGYLSLEGLLKAVPAPGGQYCAACFTGHYMTETCEEACKDCFER